MTQAKASHSKGSVAVIVSNNRLQIRFSYMEKRHYFSLEVADTQQGRKLAEEKASEIELDILNGCFDSTLAKYKPKSHLVLLKTEEMQDRENAIGLVQLWDKYTEYRKPQIAETTLKLNYQRIASHIKKIPFQQVSDATAIRDYLLEHNSAYTTKQIITQLNACCKWACESSLIRENPFKGMPEKIKLGEDKEKDIDPFTPAERDAIIQAFEQHPTYNHYAPFVRFLFATGCRTSEAVALQWKHINDRCSQITFSEAVVCVSSQKIRKDTKTHKSRKFPCNAQLQKLLQAIKLQNCEPEALVFPSLTGKEINAHTFNAMCWKGTKVHGKYQEGIVTCLVKEGKVERYRPQYNTRHTFITQCIEAGVSPVQIAKWVGNSPEIIMTHYAGTLRQVQVPEF
ncbi:MULTISPECIES: tyrosine-type recombinase/integrase [Aerosakkonema]|uniref:tyrosine-type recombinase/integrase n=1 Tax=Aerosakkonema TaxID=1246629 RepID=UPI0035BA4B84